MAKTRSKPTKRIKWIETPELLITPAKIGSKPTHPQDAIKLGETGLAVHNMTDLGCKKLYAITHIHSGRTITKYLTKTKAQKLTKKIAPLIDWTQDRYYVQQQGFKIHLHAKIAKWRNE